jgi:hypothetical protein
MAYYAVVFDPVLNRNRVFKHYYLQDVMNREGIKKGVYTQSRQAFAVCDKLNRALNEKEKKEDAR